MNSKKFSIIAICLLFVSCKNSVSTKENNMGPPEGRMSPAETTNIPDSILNEYFEDAAYLALRDIYIIGIEKDSIIEIPTDSIQIYYHGLLHVYNAISFPARDSVVSIYSIHCFPNPQTHRLLIAVDSTENWVQNWKKGNRLTGNDEVDKLMEEYDLQLEDYHLWPRAHAAVLFAPFPINILALANSFSNIDGVFSATPDQHVGAGNDIYGFMTDIYVEFHYSFGFGDCPAGCMFRHNWVFRVYYDGIVEYAESYGNRLP